MRSDASPSPPPESTRSTIAATERSSCAARIAFTTVSAPATWPPESGLSRLLPPAMLPITGTIAIFFRPPQRPSFSRADPVAGEVARAGLELLELLLELVRGHHLIDEPERHRPLGREDPLGERRPVAVDGDPARAGDGGLERADLAVEVGVDRLALLGRHLAAGELVGGVLERADPGDVPLHAELLHRPAEEGHARGEPVDRQRRLGDGVDPVRRGGDQVLGVAGVEQHRVDLLPRGAQGAHRLAELLRLAEPDPGERADLQHHPAQRRVARGVVEEANQADERVGLAQPEQRGDRAAAVREQVVEVEERDVARRRTRAPGRRGRRAAPRSRARARRRSRPPSR